MDLSPVLTVAGPLFRDVHRRQVQHFQETVIRWENRLGFRYLPELAVKAFNRVGRVDQAPDSFRILEIGRQIGPAFRPGLVNLRIL